MSGEASMMWMLAQAATARGAAADGAGDAVESVVYEIGRLHQFDNQRLAIAIAAAAAMAIAAVAWHLYRRDTVEISRPVGIVLALLRWAALAGLFVFFLGIERHTTRQMVHNSQVVVLVDVSQSMGLADGNVTKEGNHSSRLDEVVSALRDSQFIDDLRRTHDVDIARFDEDSQPVVSLSKIDATTANTTTAQIAGTPDGETADQINADWLAELQPRGTETRLGQTLLDSLRQYRGAPLASVVVISDGAQNAGVDPSVALAAAKAARVPIYTIGVGSTQPKRNVALSDLILPARAFPGDTLNVTGYVQASGYTGQLMGIELHRRRAEEPAGSGSLIASDRIVIGGDGEIVSVSFDIEPDAPGTFVYQLRIAAPDDDGNPRDNLREAEMDVVDRQTRVLLFASGPMREYQFLRDQLHRDKTMTVDILLQTAQPGISQDANKILSSFPSTREDLYQYDCIVAFDPDWTKLSTEQVALLESWIAEEAGGMIAVAGPIYTGKWIHTAEHAKLRDLYPVVFQRRIALLDDGQYSSETAWPLDWERPGREARFLWLDKSAGDSAAAWERFPGVYGYYAVKGEKPGATVYARFSDPEAGIGSQRPVYMASQFYAAGHVFFIGSGELWRLRGIDPTCFEVFYTKLIRQVSQGRMLRGSARGALIVERDRYELGETVVLRARLADAQHNPLVEPSVIAQALRPDGSTEPIKLHADVDQPGMYIGQLAVLTEGTYHVSLPIPDSDDEQLSRYLQVRVPDLERMHAQRNEILLASLASETGGVYFQQFDSAVHGDGTQRPLTELIKSKAEVKVLQGAPDQRFARLQMHWLLGIVAGSLFLEWILRRLNRLA